MIKFYQKGVERGIVLLIALCNQAVGMHARTGDQAVLRSDDVIHAQSTDDSALSEYGYEPISYYRRKRQKRVKDWWITSRVGQCVQFGARTTIELNKNLFSFASVKILAATVPFYIAARQADEAIQYPFYDPTCHKNCHQPPFPLKCAADEGMIAAILLFASSGFFAHSEEFRITGQVFGVGVLSTWAAKNIIKQIPIESNLRPWHENFSCHKRSHGGLPSGHTTEAAFMATLYGLRHGLAFGVPLGAYAAFIFGVSIASNRHYISQVIAGAAVGIMYGMAADRMIGCVPRENLTISLCPNERGGASAGLTYQF